MGRGNQFLRVDDNPWRQNGNLKLGVDFYPHRKKSCLRIFEDGLMITMFLSEAVKNGLNQLKIVRWDTEES